MCVTFYTDVSAQSHMGLSGLNVIALKCIEVHVQLDVMCFVKSVPSCKGSLSRQHLEFYMLS